MTKRLIIGGFRLSIFSLALLVILVFGVPGILTTAADIYRQQRQITAMTAENEQLQREIKALQTQKDNWDDLEYVTTQGRQRFYLVKPGEVSFLVVNDLPALTDKRPQVNQEVVFNDGHWGKILLGSLLKAGQVSAADK